MPIILIFILTIALSPLTHARGKACSSLFLTSGKTKSITKGMNARELQTLERELAKDLVSVDAAKVTPLAERFFSTKSYLSEPATAIRLLLYLGSSPTGILEVFNNDPSLYPYLLTINKVRPKNAPDREKLKLQFDRILTNGYFNHSSHHHAAFFEQPLAITALFRQVKDFYTAEERSQQISEIANRIVAVAQSKVHLRFMPQYNLYKLIKERIKRDLGLPGLEISDVLVNKIAATDKIQILAFGSKAIKDGTETPYGFSYIVLKEQRITKKQEIKVNWHHGSDLLQANILARPLKVQDLGVSKASQPNYQKMQANGEFGGLILISPNLHEGRFVQYLANEYKSFYQSNGYRFTTRGVRGDEIAKMILSEVQEGRIDYLIREGHSEGQYDRIINFSARTGVYFGQRKRSGINETVMIVYPKAWEQNSQENSSISYSSLGDSLRSRKNESDFICIEGACNAASFALSSINKVLAPNFIPISSGDGVDTFANEEYSVLRKALVGILARDRYSKMRFNRSNVERDEDGQVVERERFTFPDQDDYQGHDIQSNEKHVHIQITRDFERQSDDENNESNR